MITTINEFKEQLNKKDIIVTIPQRTKWEEYQKELDAAKNGETLNFKVRYFPKTDIGNKCFICYRNEIIGYHIISGLSEKEFTCTTTGNKFNGKFIERTGDFYKIKPIPMQGFQGYRYF